MLLRLFFYKQMSTFFWNRAPRSTHARFVSARITSEQRNASFVFHAFNDYELWKFPVSEFPAEEHRNLLFDAARNFRYRSYWTCYLVIQVFTKLISNVTLPSIHNVCRASGLPNRTRTFSNFSPKYFPEDSFTFPVITRDVK